MKRIIFIVVILAAMVSATYATEGEVQMKLGIFRPVVKKLLIKTNNIEIVVANQKEAVKAKLNPGTKVPICDSPRKEKDGQWHYVIIQECGKTIVFNSETGFTVKEEKTQKEPKRKFNPFLSLCIAMALFMAIANKTENEAFIVAAIISGIGSLFFSFYSVGAATIDSLAFPISFVVMDTMFVTFVAVAALIDVMRGHNTAIASIIFYILLAADVLVYIYLI